MISISYQNDLLHMKNESISYIIELRAGFPIHHYFGAALPMQESDFVLPRQKRSFTLEQPELPGCWSDEIPHEYPGVGRGDYRQEAWDFTMESGPSLFDFRCTAFEVHEELLTPKGLPGAGEDGRTVELVLTDASGLELHLYYGLVHDFSGIIRWNRLVNHSSNNVHIHRMASFSLETDEWEESLHLASSHLQEGRLERTAATTGIHTVSSRMGVSSGMHPPFLALTHPVTDWFSGTIVAGQLLYSGNHESLIEKEIHGPMRMQMSLHPWRFSWNLAPGESFDTPQALLSWSEGGLNGMAQNFHRMYRQHILPHHTPSILLNSWESLYYDTTLENISALARQARQVGIERFVLDDGWFRKDNSSDSPIGDWQTNLKKLPTGLQGAAELVNQLGMEFGLWVEPEAVSMNAQLYQDHPEWILHTPWQQPMIGRHEYLLDLSQTEVQDHLIALLDTLLSSAPISYLKWDMNRPFSDLKDGTQLHQYVLGLYRILDHLKQTWPQLVIEGCSSGGNRLDGGMLYYVPMNWASDNTDSFDRIQIQSGQALLFPPEALSAHISAQTNHQTGRITSLETRFQICRFFYPGYELNLSQLDEKELDAIKDQIQQLKQEREWMQQADFFCHGPDQWSKSSPDRSRCEVLIFQEHWTNSLVHRKYRVPYLKPDSFYSLRPSPADQEAGLTGQIMSGRRLQQQGFSFTPRKGDFQVYVFHIQELPAPAQPDSPHLEEWESPAGSGQSQHPD